MMKNVELSRRRLVASATAAGLAIAGGALHLGSNGRSQHVLAQGDTEEQGPATPAPLGDVVPEEFSVETNWAYENYDLNATRDVAGTSISTANIDQLGDAWMFPINAGGAFGSLTANPTIVGDVIFIQDSRANVYALDKETGEQIWANTY